MMSIPSADNAEIDGNSPTASPATPTTLRNRLPWVLVTGLLITVVITLSVKSSVERTAQLEFASRCDEIQSRIIDRLNDYARLLESGAALFSTSENVTREQWRLFTQDLKVEQQLPGIQGIGFALLVPRDQLAEHIRTIRREGFPEYALKPEGDRALYSSIIYLEPFSGRNLRAFGYDMFSEPIRRAAMEQARDTDASVLSGKVILIQESAADVQAGALMYHPVYRKGGALDTVARRRAALRGWVYSPYRMNDLMQGILGRTVPENEDQPHLRIFDGMRPLPQGLLYESPFSAGNKILNKECFTRQLQINGRLWTLCFNRTGGGLSLGAYLSIWCTMAGGVALTLLLCALIRALLNTRADAERIAAKQNRSLKASEAKYRRLHESLMDAFVKMDLQGNILESNRVLQKMLGYSSAELSTLTYVDLTPPAWHEMEARLLEEQILGRGYSDVYQKEYLTKDGRAVPIELRASLLRNSDGEPEALWAIVRDISQRKRIAAELREQAEQLRQEVVERRNIQEMLQNQKLALEALNLELEELVAAGVLEAREKDRARMQNEKMATLGQLAAGVAHEINNPMGYISSNLRLLVGYFETITRFDRLQQEHGSTPLSREDFAERRNELDMDYILTDGAELIQESLAGAEHVKKIVLGLKNFSRMDSEDKQPMALNSCLERALAIVHNELKYVATVREEYAPVPAILCHPGQLNQVFLNLLVNAGQAMVASGEIVVKCWCDDLSVYASVSDSGAGIPQEVRERIFDPFFTTKGVDKGTGLGLSISHEIIKSHQGELTVESQVGVGTTFTVRLPRNGDIPAGDAVVR